jgi:hypothetical protein
LTTGGTNFVNVTSVSASRVARGVARDPTVGYGIGGQRPLTYEHD